jgi:hypothetical protein
MTWSDLHLASQTLGKGGGKPQKSYAKLHRLLEGGTNWKTNAIVPIFFRLKSSKQISFFLNNGNNFRSNVQSSPKI